jgi:hypothetical protein
MFDTAIEDANTWNDITSISSQIEAEHYVPARMELRRERMKLFLSYIHTLESKFLELLAEHDDLASIAQVEQLVLKEVDDAVKKSIKYHS